MKGVKKCFGLSLLFFTMVGLSLSASSDVNATKYTLSSIPLYTYYYTQNNQDYPFSLDDLQFTFATGNSPTDSSSWDWNKTEAPFYFSAKLDNNSCVYNRLFYPNASGHWSADNYGHLVAPRFNVYYNRLCQSLGPMSNFNKQSLLSATALSDQARSNLSSILPYWTEYSAYVLEGDTVIDGVHYDSHGFTFSQVLGSDNLKLVEKPKSFNLPLGVFHDILRSANVTEDSHIDFNFSILIDSVSGLDTDSIASSVAQIKAIGYDVTDLSSTVGDNATCSISVDSIDEFGANIDFLCPWDSSHEYGNLVGFQFNWSTSNEYLFYAHDGMNNFAIEGGSSPFNVITDYDYTPGGSIGAQNIGSNPTSAPGAPGNGMVNPNYNSSLSNLFAFNFINPFAPIFSLFNNNDSCANIPIIAGMLHAENTTVCPWFDSTTRNIVTPVLGLSAMMLVFGFTVRWLGSRSGNFVEDSGGIDSGGLHFENKYRRKK